MSVKEYTHKDRMNKNKKVTILTMAALCAMFATGCGSSVESKQEEIGAFVESHNKIVAAMVRDVVVVGVDELTDEMGIDLDLDLEKDLILPEVMKQEKANLKKTVKSKVIKKMNKKVYEFYDENDKLIEELKKGDMDLYDYSDKLTELTEDYVEVIQDEYMEDYDKLRVKAEMDEIEEYDPESQAAEILEILEDEYMDDIKKMITKGVASSYMDSLTDGMKTGGEESLTPVIEKLSIEDSLPDVKVDSDGGVDLSEFDKGDTKEADESKDESEDQSKNAKKCEEFLKSIAKDNEEKDKVYRSDDYGTGSLDIEGANDGYVSVWVGAEEGKIDRLSIDMHTEGDEAKFESRIESILKSFCKETGLNKDDVFKKLKETYKTLSSDKFVNSTEAKKDFKDYSFMPLYEELNEDVDVSMYLYNPDSKDRDRLSIDIDIYDFN